MLFKTIANKFKANKIPATLLEKYCVMAMSVMTGRHDFAPFATLKVEKDFHLYGARMKVTLGNQDKFLLDWAYDQKILNRSTFQSSKTKASPDDSEEDYTLYSLIDHSSTYPNDDSSWGIETVRAVQDLAELVKIISTTDNLKSNALIAITSLATESDFFKAIAAELHCWLYDKENNINIALQEIGKIADNSLVRAIRHNELVSTDKLLQRTANYIAQARNKVLLRNKIQTIYDQIANLIIENTIAERIWEDYQRFFLSGSQDKNNTVGLPQTLSAIRLAHACTSLLRNFLSFAGLNHKKAIPIKDSINKIISILDDRNMIDRQSLWCFKENDGSKALDTLLKDQSDISEGSLLEIYQAITPIVFKIIEGCALILQTYGPYQYRDQPKLLTPPRFILMWDIIGSSKVNDREAKLTPNILRYNEIITNTKPATVEHFESTTDDGNGVVCTTFNDILAVFEILSNTLSSDGYNFRAGVSVNLQGSLNYYPQSKLLGGRAYEHAARVRDYFKEIQKKEKEPAAPFLIVEEFAQRWAEQENEWPLSGYRIEEIEEQYKPRVANSLAVKLFILTKDNV